MHLMAPNVRMQHVRPSGSVGAMGALEFRFDSAFLSDVPTERFLVMVDLRTFRAFINEFYVLQARRTLCVVVFTWKCFAGLNMEQKMVVHYLRIAKNNENTTQN